MSDTLWEVVALALLMISIQVGGGFVAAQADATVLDSSTLEISITVEAAPGTDVVVHMVDPGGDQRTVAMIESTPGVYRTVFETRPVDLVAVFEDLAAGTQSDPLRLSEIGVAPELVGAAPPVPTGPEPEDRSLLWLGGALAAASLSALAFWVLGGADKPVRAGASAAPEAELETS
ncbi:MAG: hypothetical protein ACFCVC_13105 [Acidimicrobiia bacterium]